MGGYVTVCIIISTVNAIQAASVGLFMLFILIQRRKIMTLLQLQSRLVGLSISENDVGTRNGVSRLD
jgi:hypothetical protein